MLQALQLFKHKMIADILQTLKVCYPSFAQMILEEFFRKIKISQICHVL